MEKADKSQVRAEFLTAQEVAQYLKKSDLAILPVGCLEMHGPPMVLGCDTLHTYAVSVVLAEEWGCLVLPPITYAYPGATSPWPGTVGPGPIATIRHVHEVARAALQAGFRRLVLLATHGPLSFILRTVVREIHHDTGEVIVCFTGRDAELMPDDLVEEVLGYKRGPLCEDLMVLAATRILGLPEDAYVPDVKSDSWNVKSETSEEHSPSEALSRFYELGFGAGWNYSDMWQHQAARKRVKSSHADKAAEVMRRAAKRYAQVPELYAQLKRDMAHLRESRPWAVDRVLRRKSADRP